MACASQITTRAASNTAIFVTQRGCERPLVQFIHECIHRNSIRQGSTQKLSMMNTHMSTPRLCRFTNPRPRNHRFINESNIHPLIAWINGRAHTLAPEFALMMAEWTVPHLAHRHIVGSTQHRRKKRATPDISSRSSPPSRQASHRHLRRDADQIPAPTTIDADSPHHQRLDHLVFRHGQLNGRFRCAAVLNVVIDVCFPVKIKGASAGWIRAVAIFED